MIGRWGGEGRGAGEAAAEGTADHGEVEEDAARRGGDGGGWEGRASRQG